MVRLSIHLQDGTQQQVCGETPIEPERCENAPTSAYFYVKEKRSQELQLVEKVDPTPQAPQ